MDLLEKILNCRDEEVDNIITDAINKSNENSTNVKQLGFVNEGSNNLLFKGFIPLNIRIKYEKVALETYKMTTTDFFYEFAHFIRKNNINNKGKLIYSLESFINNYFGYQKRMDRSVIFNDIAWKTTTTDDEYFKALENNQIGDLKGMNAAECTERSALAQQILSLFGIESFYCMGCVDLEDRQEAHCFNIVKKQNGYALVDYSIPVALFNDRKLRTYYPFVGEMSSEEFIDFSNNGVLKTFDNYEYHNGNNKILDGSKRTYVVGSFQIEKENEVKR